MQKSNNNVCQIWPLEGDITLFSIDFFVRTYLYSNDFSQEAMKNYLEKKVRGDLISQREDFLKRQILKPVI